MSVSFCLCVGVHPPMPYLDFHLDILSCDDEVIQGLLGMLHVAAVLAIDQQPVWRIQGETLSLTTHH